MSIFNLPPPPATSDVTALSWRDWFYKLTVALKTFVASALPSGGTTGQFLKKNSNADQDAGWYTVTTLLPSGGTTGQTLTKNSNADQDAGWATPTSILPSGGTTGQLLTKNSNADQDAGWVTYVPLPNGGTTGQVLTKHSNADQDVAWSATSTDLTNYMYLPGRAGGQVLYGGTGVTDTIKLIGTTANGTGTAAAIQMAVGNNGGTPALSFTNQGRGFYNGASQVDDYESNFAGGISVVSSGGDHSGSNGALYVQSTTYETAINGYSVSGIGVSAISTHWSPLTVYQYGAQTSNVSAAVLEVAKTTSGAYNNTAHMIEVWDYPTVSGTVGGSALLVVVNGTNRINFYPRVADGASAVAYFLDTLNTLSNASAKLLDIRNHGTSKLSLLADGTLKMTVPANYADDAAAATGGVPVGGVYRNGSVLQIRVT